MMKLEVNVKGSWRSVCEFEEINMARVLDAVGRLSCAIPRAKWRVLDRDGRRRWVFADGMTEEYLILQPPAEAS